MSYKAEVQTAGNGDRWSGNDLRFETKEEAQVYVQDLMYRWTAVTDTRVVESEEHVNA